MVAKVGPSYRVHIAWQNITLGFQSPLQKDTTFLGAQIVKNLPPMQETQVQSLGWEDPLEKDLATNPLQFSCLENSIDRGAWQAVVHGVPIELDTTECLTLSLSTERHKYIS